MEIPSFKESLVLSTKLHSSSSCCSPENSLVTETSSSSCKDSLLLPINDDDDADADIYAVPDPVGYRLGVDKIGSSP
jgi:hypothetical protein